MTQKTIRITLSLFVLMAALLAGSRQMMAHHAFASEFDSEKKVNMDGTVAEMQWTNPHAWLWLNVKGQDGVDQKWGFEFGAPNALFRRGWTKSSVPVGMKITVEAFLAKDGRKIANAKTVTLPDGRALFAGSEGTGAPSDGPKK